MELLNRLIIIEKRIYDFNQKLMKKEQSGSLQVEFIKEICKNIELCKIVEKDLLKKINIDGESFDKYMKFLNHRNHVFLKKDGFRLSDYNQLGEAYELEELFYFQNVDDFKFAIVNMFEKNGKMPLNPTYLDLVDGSRHNPILMRISYLLFDELYKKQMVEDIDFPKFYDEEVVNLEFFLKQFIPTFVPMVERTALTRLAIYANLDLEILSVIDSIKDSKHPYFKRWIELKYIVSYINPRVEDFMLQSLFRKDTTYNKLFSIEVNKSYTYAMMDYIGFYELKNSIMSFKKILNSTSNKVKLFIMELLSTVIQIKIQYIDDYYFDSLKADLCSIIDDPKMREIILLSFDREWESRSTQKELVYINHSDFIQV